jgi:hypothetical protein
MLRGLPHLTKYMPCHEQHSSLLPDPENEPNLGEISQRYPVPQAAQAACLPYYMFDQPRTSSPSLVSSLWTDNTDPDEAQWKHLDDDTVAPLHSYRSVLGRY